MIFFLQAVGLYSMTMTAHAVTTVRSGPARTHLLELFTSEGCSSCPPAESWFSGLRTNPRLWKDVVPVSFHINYWDDLGWVDALATPDFTQRQRSYAAAWRATNVYTPAFVLDGAEWRERNLSAIGEGAEAGLLSATLGKDGKVEISFQPTEGGGKWQAYAALLGYGVSSDVRAGENGGRHLVHDFVALAMQDAPITGEKNTTVIQLPSDKMTPGRTAFAVWVTRAGNLAPVQAAGGDL